MPIIRNPPGPPPQPAAPSAEVLALRTNWKWAYLSHFLFTYNPVLHLEDIQLSELEDDLALGTYEVIPTVIQRLLMSLTPHDKRMILEDWQQQLRKQSLKRAPDHNLMGTEDEPVDFTSLIMSDKLDLFQALCEWQFHNPNNLRARMRDDDEYANWRMEPIAYDAKRNAYWLMGGNRLWIQHSPPPKRATRSHKRKQPAATNGRKSAKRRQPAATSSKATTTTFTMISKPRVPAANLTSGRPLRETRSRGGPSTQRASRPVGTRVSSRLRGREEEEIWQPIPEEWLKEEPKDGATESSDSDEKDKGEVESVKDIVTKSLDDVSELTSLSDLSELPEVKEDVDEDGGEGEGEDDYTPPPPADIHPSNEEVWETVCVTLADWEAFPQRFEKSTHRGEKAFYKLLTNDLVPMITEVLRVDVRKKVMEEAVVHRKRSSRIAVKESVREAERAEAKRKADEEKEMERHRRWETRARKEEEERIKRENMRSTRLRERGRTGSETVDVDVVGGVLDEKPSVTNGSTPDTTASVTTPIKFVVNVSKSGTQTPKDDAPWELDCEICHRRGMNLDDGQELMCCERCNKWQHIRCHDQADFIAGRPRRNWELEDFVCSACTVNRQAAPYGRSSHYQLQSLNNSANTQILGEYNGTMVTSNHPISVQSQPEHRKAAPVKSALKQSSYDATPYSNGRPDYVLPRGQTHVQPSHPSSAASLNQYAQRSQPSTTTMTNARYSSLNSSQGRTSAVPHSTQAPYASGPNMYLSNYSGNYRPPQTIQPQPTTSPSYYRPNIPVAQAGVWSQQQAQYSQLASHQAWNGAAHGSGPQPYTTSGTSVTQPVQQNRYYRQHSGAPSDPLVPPNHVLPAQQYSTGGSSSQS